MFNQHVSMSTPQRCTCQHVCIVYVYTCTYVDACSRSDEEDEEEDEEEEGEEKEEEGRKRRIRG